MIIVYKDGSWKNVTKDSAWEYQNDPDYLVSIPLEESAQQSAQRNLLTEREFKITCQNCGAVVGRAIGKTPIR